jgi:hypothetical protein
MLPTMGQLVDLPGARSRWFADERGRSQWTTWHPESGLVVFSLWNADQCVGTFRLSATDAAELGGLIDQALAHRAEQEQGGVDAAPATGT